MNEQLCMFLTDLFSLTFFGEEHFTAFSCEGDPTISDSRSRAIKALTEWQESPERILRRGADFGA